MEIIVLIGIGVIVFLSLREFWCWYFKINEQTRLTKKLVEQRDGDINKTLNKMNQTLELVLRHLKSINNASQARNATPLEVLFGGHNHLPSKEMQKEGKAGLDA